MVVIAAEAEVQKFQNQHPPLRWEAPDSFLKESGLVGRQIQLPDESVPIYLQPFDHRHPALRNTFRPERASLPKVLYAPAPDPASDRGLWSLLALPLGLGALGGGAGALFNPGERWKYAKRGAGIGAGAGLIIEATACATPSAEVAPAPIVEAADTPFSATEISVVGSEFTTESIKESNDWQLWQVIPADIASGGIPLIRLTGGMYLYEGAVGTLHPVTGAELDTGVKHALGVSFYGGGDTYMYHLISQVGTDPIQVNALQLDTVRSDASTSVYEVFHMAEENNTKLITKEPYTMEWRLTESGDYEFIIKFTDGREIPLGLATNTPDSITPVPTKIPVGDFNASFGIPAGAQEIRFVSDGGATETGPKVGGTYAETKNGREYVYVNGERKVADIFLFDWPTPNGNGARVQFFTTDKVQDERSLYQMTQDDFTSSEIPASGIFDPPPVTALFLAKLEERTGKSVQELIQVMQGEGVSLEIIIPSSTPEGKTEHVNLTRDTGMIITMMDFKTLKELGGELVSEPWHVGGIAVYSYLGGVDDANNMLVGFAIDGSLAELSDEDLRNIIFSFISRLVEDKDQRKQGITSPSQFFAIESAKLYNGLPNIEIERVPQTSP